NLAHATVRTWILQNNFPLRRLRITLDTRDRHNMIENTPAQLCADHAHGLVGGGVFLRQRWRNQKQQRRKRFPHSAKLNLRAIVDLTSHGPWEPVRDKTHAPRLNERP